MMPTKKYFLALVILISLCPTEREVRADFALNFLPSDHLVASSITNNQQYTSCNIPGLTDAFCVRGNGIANADPANTPFLRETVIIDGVTYQHMIVGSIDPVTGLGFAQETYIRNGAGIFSSSGGKPGCNSFRCLTPETWMGNGLDPLQADARFTGNGSGDPTRTVIRQVLNTAEMQQEFLKAALDRKPKITQNITVSGQMISEFILDMSSSTYNANTPGALTNKLTLLDPSIPAASAFFDIATSSQASNITGGQFTFGAGAGWLDTGLSSPTDDTYNYDAGAYTYSGGDSFNLTGADWQAYRNPAENP